MKLKTKDLNKLKVLQLKNILESFEGEKIVKSKKVYKKSENLENKSLQKRKQEIKKSSHIKSQK